MAEVPYVVSMASSSNVTHAVDLETDSRQDLPYESHLSDPEQRLPQADYQEFASILGAMNNPTISKANML